MNDKFELIVVDVDNISDQRWEQYYDLLKELRAETDPLRPVGSLDEIQTSWHNVPPFADASHWWIVDRTTDEIVGKGDLTTLNELMPKNRHLAQIDIAVRPAYRRQGIGTALLATIVASIEATGQTVIIGATQSAVPAGEAFASQTGAKMGLAAVENQLKLRDLDLNLMRQWREVGDTLADSYELLFVAGRYPDELIDAIVDVRHAMNSAPLDDLDVEDIEYSADNVRQLEQSLLHSGRQRWTYAVRHIPSQKLAGYTEVILRPSAPLIAFQGETAVAPEFRGNRIGRWLKAAMIERIINELPTIEFVRTGNANSNAPMLKINTEMGFKPHVEDKVWQLSTSEARTYLDK